MILIKIMLFLLCFWTGVMFFNPNVDIWVKGLVLGIIFYIKITGTK